MSALPQPTPALAKGSRSASADSTVAEAARRLKSYQALVTRAGDVFGDPIKASIWLSTPSADFNGMVPLEAAQNVNFDGAKIEELFEPVFAIIEHGIYV